MSTKIRTADAVATWPRPRVVLGALVGVAVVLVFTVAHDLWISDIWFNIGPMVFAGALSGGSIVWSYRKTVGRHSTRAWFGYGGLYAVELIGLGAVSLLVLQPRFTMAELLVRDDAFELLLPPTLPLMAVAIAIGTIAMWLGYGRPRAALIPILVTQALLVFLLGHQFAFLGLVSSSSTLFVAYGEFFTITIVLAAAFCAGVTAMTLVLGRYRARNERKAASSDTPDGF